MSLKRCTSLLLIVFLIFFPKGGFKIGGIPLTWGYLLLALIAMLLSLRRQHHFNARRSYALIALIPFQLLALILITLNGFLHTGHFIALLVSLYLLPLIFLYLLSEDIDSVDREWLFSWISRGVLFTALLGIALFFTFLYSARAITIPYLTINGDDAATFLEDKFNFRGSLFKLISTYNNGNLYGVCMLMLLPIFYYTNRSSWIRLILRIALLLTLSRTIWAALLIVELLYAGYVERKWIKIPIILTLFFLALFSLSTLFNFPLPVHFLFDPKMGGRLSFENMLHSLDLFTNKPFLVISEFIYFGVLRDFGLVTAIAFTGGMVAPVVIYLAQPEHFPQGEQQRALVLSPIAYLITALSDGAILLIPTMAIYWSLCALMLTPLGARARNSTPSGASTKTTPLRSLAKSSR